MYRAVLFDLDGTLTDPYEGITKSVAYALARFGIEVPDRRALRPFIGPPLAESFSKYYGLSDGDALKAVDVYREYFSVTGIFENEVYPGVPEMLRDLKNSGRAVALATSKPTVFAKRILEHFSLDGYFDSCIGSELDGRRVDKAEVIAETLTALGVPAGSAIMVGDRMHDVAGAQKNGVKCVGAAYGYGSISELSDAGAAFIVDSVDGLSSLLLSL